MSSGSGSACVRIFSSRPADSIRLANARGAALQPPGVAQCRDREPAALGGAGRTLSRGRRRNFFPAFQFAIGGIGQHVESQRQRGVDLGLHHGAVFFAASRTGQLPQARERRLRISGRVRRHIDHARATARLDAPERPQLLGIDLLLGVPDRMLLFQQVQLVFGLGKHVEHQFAKALVEAGAAAIAFRKQEPATIHVVAQLSRHRLAFDCILRDRTFVAAKIEDGDLQHFLDRCQPHVDHLPGQIAFPPRLDVAREVGHVAAMVVPIIAGAMLQFAQQPWPTSLGEKKQGEAGADEGISLDGRTAPEARQGILIADQGVGALAIPVGPASPRRQRQESLGGEPPGALQAVEIIEPPELPARVRGHRKVLSEPLQPRSTRLSFVAWGTQHSIWSPFTRASLDWTLSAAITSEVMPAHVMLPVGGPPADG